MSRFGMLSELRVFKKKLSDGKRHSFSVCRCSCGKESIARRSHLLNGHTRSCGCMKSEGMKRRNFKHGHAYRSAVSTEYNIWASMINRCTNRTCHAYKNYGGRGIRVCQRWRASFQHFLEDMGRRPKNLTLDRIDNDRGYSPLNCRWATRKQQAITRRPRQNENRPYIKVAE